MKGEGKMKKIWSFIKEEDGLETVEWAIIAALVVVGLVTTIATLGTHVKSAFTNLASATAS